MTRNRQVWPREQVAHLWANASQDSARDPSGNMYFSGPALYSYGSHYVIGYRYATPDGSAFFILNADSSSPTTNKMRGIASHAIARFYTRVHVGGLRGGTFSGRGWRGRLLRDALAQAGRLYAEAGNVSRVSLKRDAIVSEAGQRILAAQTLADAIMADKASATDDKRAARAALATLAKVAAVAWPHGGDNKAERAACDALASLLVRDEQRAIFAGLVAGAIQSADHATVAERRWTRRADDIRDAAEKLARARDLAKRYGFRLPRLPDVDAIAAFIKPHADAERLAVVRRDARAALESAEQSARYARTEGGASWHASSVAHYAEQVRDAANSARGYGGDVPAWMIERADNLKRRTVRAGILESAGRDLDKVPGAMQSADSYAAAGHARDAAREYGRAARIVDAVAVALADTPRHPVAPRLAAMTAERDRAAAYVATLAERIAAEDAERIAAWRDGRDNRPAFRAYDMPPMLRLSADGRSVETSHGAVVPVTIAPRLWRLIEQARGGDAAKVSAAFRGLHVGPFTLAEIRADGSAVIGCHDIPHAEMAALAARLNLHS